MESSTLNSSTLRLLWVIALASHQCGPGSKPGPGVISGLSLLLVLALLWGFFSGFSSFPPSKKINISKFLFNSEFKGHRFVSLWLLCVTLVKQSSFRYYYYYYATNFFFTGDSLFHFSLIEIHFLLTKSERIGAGPRFSPESQALPCVLVRSSTNGIDLQQLSNHNQPHLTNLQCWGLFSFISSGGQSSWKMET